MNASFRQQLYNLAVSQRDETIHLRSYAQPFDDSHLGMKVYELACSTRGSATLPNSDIMPTFFTEQAIGVLRKMPNLYWFWCVVANAVIADDGDDSEHLGKASVQDAVLAVRRDHAFKYNLQKPLAELADNRTGDARREVQIASRAAAGLILIKVHACELDEMLDNPLFFDATFIN